MAWRQRPRRFCWMQDKHVQTKICVPRESRVVDACIGGIFSFDFVPLLRPSADATTISDQVRSACVLIPHVGHFLAWIVRCALPRRAALEWCPLLIGSLRDSPCLGLGLIAVLALLTFGSCSGGWGGGEGGLHMHSTQDTVRDEGDHGWREGIRN